MRSGALSPCALPVISSITTGLHTTSNRTLFPFLLRRPLMLSPIGLHFDTPPPHTHKNVISLPLSLFLSLSLNISSFSAQASFTEVDVCVFFFYHKEKPSCISTTLSDIQATNRERTHSFVCVTGSKHVKNIKCCLSLCLLNFTSTNLKCNSKWGLYLINIHEAAVWRDRRGGITIKIKMDKLNFFFLVPHSHSVLQQVLGLSGKRAVFRPTKHQSFYISFSSNPLNHYCCFTQPLI